MKYRYNTSPTAKLVWRIFNVGDIWNYIIMFCLEQSQRPVASAAHSFERCAKVMLSPGLCGAVLECLVSSWLWMVLGV